MSLPSIKNVKDSGVTDRVPACEPTSSEQETTYVERVAQCFRRLRMDAGSWEEEMRNREGWVATL